MRANMDAGRRHQALSKLNLYLRITGKRADGYHELESLFIPVAEPCDTLTIQPSQEDTGVQLTGSVPGLPLDMSNLCAKAVSAYAKFAVEKKQQPIETGWSIDIRKSIPIAAGMGGGSSDAACVLNSLNAHYQLFDADEMVEIAVTLGADVPFFLQSRPAVATGVGEKLQYLDIEHTTIPLLIIAPMFPVRTEWCFKQINVDDCLTTSHVGVLLDAIGAKDWPLVGRYLHNDLGKAVFAKFPVLSMLKRDLREQGACGVELTGSGPTLFAVGEDFQHLGKMKQNLVEKYPREFAYFIPNKLAV